MTKHAIHIDKYPTFPPNSDCNHLIYHKTISKYCENIALVDEATFWSFWCIVVHKFERKAHVSKTLMQQIHSREQGELIDNWGRLCARTGRIVDVRRWRVHAAYVAPIAQW